MIKRLLGSLFFTFSVMTSSAVAEDVIAITGGAVFEGYEAPAIANGVVIVKGNRIVEVGPDHAVTIPEGATIIDARGKTVMPGMVDLHMHLDLIGHGDYDRYYKFINGMERLPEIMPIAAKQIMRAGITTAVDLGSPFVILDVRDRIRRGEIPGPRLVVSGPWITRVKLDGVPDDYQIVVKNPEDAYQKTKENIRRGSDVIKTWLGLTRADLDAVVRAAHEEGVKVHSHLYKPDAIRMHIDAGVDVLQHVGSAKNPPYPDELVSEIAHKKLPVVQTISHRIWVYPKTQEFPSRLNTPVLERDIPADLYADMQDSFKHINRLSYFKDIGMETRNAKKSAGQFIAAGAYMAVGTDAASPLNFHNEAMWHELAALVEVGMTPMQALSAATKTGAEVIGRINDLGTLEPGKLADIIIVDGNPLSDINVMQNIDMTMKDGVIWIDGEDNPLKIGAIGRKY